jgi:ribonuclease D
MGIIGSMKNELSAPPRLIEDQKALNQLIPQLQSQKRLAIDTESNSLYAYTEQVCLIQISIPGSDFLLDTIRLTDLPPMESIMMDEQVEKILHGAEYDVVCLKRDFNFIIHNLFDTRVALRTLGRKRTGLGDILEEEFGVKINKKWQRANWGQRPLPSELLNYARLDTHFLLALRDRLAKKLKDCHRWEEAKEECERISQFEPNNNGFHPNKFWKISNAKQLQPSQAAILKEVYSFRDEQARHLNRPPFKVIPDKSLLAIAQSKPKNEEELLELPGMTPGQIRRYGQGLLNAVKQGLKSPPPVKPKSEHIEDEIVNRYKHLRKWRKQTAEARGVDSDIILPREIMWSIAFEKPLTRKKLRQLMLPLEWRFGQYCDDILKVIQR